MAGRAAQPAATLSRAYSVVSWNAVSGTDLVYGIVYGAVSPYAVSCTDMAYGVVSAYAVCGTDVGFGATRGFEPLGPARA
eukprot:3941296-Rhodomonas_salina.3